MKIGEVANKCGINASAIRFYERQGLISAGNVVRAENGYRNYSFQEVERISLICKFKEFGLELDEIKSLLGDDSKVCNDLIASIDNQLDKYQAMSQIILQKIARLEQTKRSCKENCLAENKVKKCCG